MRVNKIFYIFSSLLILSAGFVFVSPSLIRPDFIYPERLDSLYIRYRLIKDPAAAGQPQAYNPSDVGLNYQDFSIVTDDSLILRGWYVPVTDTTANTILILHDVNQSKIGLLEHFRQFHDRGLHVCAVDLRAHGNSDGDEFTPGSAAVNDVLIMLDSLFMKSETKNVVIMGMGTGAAIAMQAAVIDSRCGALVLQSPFNTLSVYLDRYARKEWEVMHTFWKPVFFRKTESILGYDIKNLDLRVIATYLSVPVFFVCAEYDRQVYTSETFQVFDSTASAKKELILIRDAAHNDIHSTGGERYYNRISGFIASSFPKKQKKTKFKRLAFNDKPRYD